MLGKPSQLDLEGKGHEIVVPQHLVGWDDIEGAGEGKSSCAVLTSKLVPRRLERGTGVPQCILDW